MPSPFWSVPGALFALTATTNAQLGPVVDLTFSFEEPAFSFPMDVDGDGAMDVILIDSEAGASTLLLNRPGDPLQAVQTINAPGSCTHALTLDVDEDGREDLVLGRQQNGLIVWLRALPEGRLGDPVTLLPADGIRLDPSLADMDGDGRLDLVVGRRTGVVWYPNTSPGQFGTEQLVNPTLLPMVDYLTTGDVDGDGDEDVIAAVQSTGHVILYTNPGSGVFPPGQVLFQHSPGWNSVSSGDLDSDGDLDVVVGTSSPARVHRLRNLGGTLGFSPATVIASDVGTGFPSQPVVTLQDLDQDGRTDLFMAGTSAYYSSPQDASGLFLPTGIIAFSQAIHDRPPLVDVTGDGLDDVLMSIGHTRWRQIRAYQADSWSNSLEVISDLLVPPRGEIVVDYDRDGDLDVIAVAGGAGIFSHEVRLYRNMGGRTFSTGTNLLDDLFEYPVFTAVADRLVVGADDFTGDGRVDLLLIGRSGFGQPTEVLLAQGEPDGGVASPVALFRNPDSGSVILEAVVDDLDGDGSTDLVYIDRASRSVQWVPDLGPSSLLAAPITLASLTGEPNDLQLVDIDADGRKDVVVVDPQEDVAHLLRNLGGGAFQAMPGIRSVGTGLNFVEFSDMDGDGHVDAVWNANFSPNGNVYLAAGDGSFGFQPSTAISTGGYGATDLALADLDADGDKDVVLLNPLFDATWVENLGGGAFSPPTGPDPSLEGISRSLVADMDNDGVDDLVLLGTSATSTGFMSVALGGADLLLGESVCGPAVPNSIGLDARMTGRGSSAATDNNARLIANRLPPGAFGYFLASTMTSAPMPVVGSDGLLCLTGAVGRLNRSGEVQQVSLSGEMSLQLDLSSLPTPTGAVSAMPGQTWAFQAWHRDAGTSGPTSNFSDALTIAWE